MGVYLNPGKTNYQMAINSEIFVDKSEMILFINSLINTNQRFVSVSRPRRFGKTMAADMLCDKSQFTTIAELLPRLYSNVKVRQEARLDALNSSLVHNAHQKLSTLDAQLSTVELRLPTLLDRRLMTEKHRLQLIEEKARSLDPALLLSRGYSITLKDGKAIRDARQLRTGDDIETRLANGTIHSTVK